MMRAPNLLLAAVLWACVGTAAACGVCIEDKVAVTYDHAVVTDATARKHVVVFAAVEAKGDAQRAARDVKSAALRVRGVDRETVRAAASPAALSFALDPAVAAPEQALISIERASPTPVKLSLLRVVR
jgi:hypothetical protein